MIKVNIKKESDYDFNEKALKEDLKKKLEELKVPASAKVGVAVIDEPTMKSLGQKYLNETKSDPPHNVLSFPEKEVVGKFIAPKEEENFLGEIVICFPVAQKIAKKEKMTVDEVLWVLAEHASLHLLGIHHDH